MTIYPTGTCFDDALDGLFHRIFKLKHNKNDYILVHAICNPFNRPKDEDNSKMAHAWIENINSNLAIFDGFINDERVTVEQDIKAHRKSLNISKLVSYTWDEAFLENYKSNHYGLGMMKLKNILRMLSDYFSNL